MSPDQRSFWRWTASGAALVAVGWGIAIWRGSERDSLAAEADRLHGRYVELYHPDKPGGLAVEDAQNELRKATTDQAEELKTAEAALAPPLPDAYTRTDLADANSQVQADLESLRQLSTRTRVAIPSTLPFQTGLDADAKGRSRQLAQLLLLRMAVQSALHAGVAKVTAVTPGEAFSSPGKEYAVFTCSLELEATWPATARLLGAFSGADGRGLGLRGLEIEAPSGLAEQPQKVRLIATLTAPNRESWGLAAPPAGAASGTAPAAPGDAGNRLRRLGAARP